MARKFDPRDFIIIGERVAQCQSKDCCIPSNEALYRTAISRIYYSVFLRLREYFGIKQHQSVHQKVINALYYRGYIILGHMLEELRDHRTIADYNLRAKITREKVKAALTIAIDLHKQIDLKLYKKKQ